MKLENVKIEGLKIIKSKIYRDKRGFLREIYKNRLFKDSFLFDVMSNSKKNVLRGLHIQTKKYQAKIITVTQGKILDVAVDLRKNSKTFGKYFSIIISQNSEFSFYIPKGFAHGFLCLSKECTVNYKCSQYRHKKSETTLSWNDKDVGIKWPIKKPILSIKDKKGKSLSHFK
ncbi:MAG: dTDP-4-dehydrorhamnose 3,5-epimerase [Candidatus Pelagibacter sp. TMED197]|nr:MAG: dTDP-4-dehydrorhamnose 3,5-epimerase [Candidatus Pelagibacter sp. TMED197]|tara:strand:+ start:1131 stop:1646 length:516 start_codon:yes stop_codon:yes gene_type:complete